MILFLVVVREFFSSWFGVWGLYLTKSLHCLTVATGAFANGLTPLFDHRSRFSEKQILGAGLFFHLNFNCFCSALLPRFAGPDAPVFGICPEMEELLKLSFSHLWWKYWYVQVFRALASQKGKKVVLYLLLNLSYLRRFCVGVWVDLLNGELSLSNITLVQRFLFSFPFGLIQVLLFGKFGFSYAAIGIENCCKYGNTSQGINLIFAPLQKGWYLHDWLLFETCSRGLFTGNQDYSNTSSFPLFSHWAQTIYPRLAATSPINMMSLILKRRICPRGIRFFICTVSSPAALVVCFLQPDKWPCWVRRIPREGTVPTLMILVPATWCKPWGRAWLALDAVGKPQVLTFKCWIQLDGQYHPEFQFWIQAFWLAIGRQRQRLASAIRSNESFSDRFESKNYFWKLILEWRNPFLQNEPLLKTLIKNIMNLTFGQATGFFTSPRNWINLFRFLSSYSIKFSAILMFGNNARFTIFKKLNPQEIPFPEKPGNPRPRDWLLEIMLSA